MALAINVTNYKVADVDSKAEEVALILKSLFKE